jgi:hypothetical protein
LWHATDDKTGATSFFLYFNGENSRVFNADWIEVDSGFQLEGNSFQFKAPFKTYGIKINGQVRAGKMQGGWQIPHPQYPMKGSWSAELLFYAEDWSPWGYLKRGERIVDLVKILKAGHPYKDERSFLKFWATEVEPVFFTLLVYSLYSHGESGYDPTLRESKPKEVYKQLQASGNRLFERSAKVKNEITQILSTLQKSYPWLKPSVPVGNVLSLGYFDFRLVKAGSEGLLMFGADWIAENAKDKEARRILAEGLICSFHSSYLGLPAQVASEFFYRSVANQILEQVKPLSGETQQTSEKESSDLESLKEQLWEDILLPSILFFPTYMKGSKRTQAYLLFRQFGDALSVNRKPIDLFRLNKNEMRKLLAEFFRPVKLKDKTGSSP